MKRLFLHIPFPAALALVLASNLSFGCRKLVTVSSPENLQVTATVFSDPTSATAAMTSIYAQMSYNSFPFNVPALTGISGDELQTYSSTPDIVGFYTDALVPLNATIGPDLWNQAYQYIYQANAVLQGVQQSGTLNPSVARQLTGEAKFLRAFLNFYLVNLFGDIPLSTTTDYTITSVEPRSPASAVYQQIVSDLLDAQASLSPNFVDASDTTRTTERTRPTSWAATALLARVYLYMDDWQDADKESTLVINNGGLFQLVTSLSDVFLMNSNEAIWQIQPAYTNTPEGEGFLLTSSPASAGLNQTMTLSPQLRAAFDSGDARFANWVDSVGSFYFPYKYKMDGTAAATTEYSMVLRLAEQYLIRAEARLRKGNITGPSGAIGDIDMIRERAGLADYAGALDTASLSAAILHERQVELFAEWGHRWLDLKRTGSIDGVMGGPNGVCALKGGGWQDAWQLYPIPQTERNNDPALTQNNGY